MVEPAPVFRGVQIGELGRIGHPNVSYRKSLSFEKPENVCDSADACIECVSDHRMAPPLVHGAKGFQLTVGVAGQDAIAIRTE